MCGRVVQKTPLHEIRVLFETVNPLPNGAATYNGAPTDTLPVVRLDREGRRSLDLLRWGLIPYWAKDRSIGPRCINAMFETLASKPAFREAFRRRRCLVPADFFYEWQKLPAANSPMRSGSPMAARWRLPAYGSGGMTLRQPANRSTRSASSPGRQTNCARRFTTACRRSCRARPGAGGSVKTQRTRMILPICCARTRPN